MRVRIAKANLYFMVPSRVFSLNIRSARLVGGIFTVHPNMERNHLHSKLWTVTHHKSGFAVGYDFPSRANAVAAAQSLTRIRAPWNMSDRWKIQRATPQQERKKIVRVVQKFRRKGSTT